MADDVQTLTDLALRLKKSRSWTYKHWRSLAGLPAPFMGAGDREHPRWRKAELDRYFGAPDDTGAPAAAALHKSVIMDVPANPEELTVSALLRAAGA